MKLLRYIYVIFKRRNEIKNAIRHIVTSSPEYITSELPNFLKTKKTLVTRVNYKSTDPRMRENFLNTLGKNYKEFSTSK